jgi:hypothetical protein
MALYNVAAAVVDLIEAPDEETAKAKMREKIVLAGMDFYEGEITSPSGIDAFESEDLG